MQGVARQAPREAGLQMDTLPSCHHLLPLLVVRWHNKDRAHRAGEVFCSERCGSHCHLPLFWRSGLPGTGIALESWAHESAEPPVVVDAGLEAIVLALPVVAGAGIPSGNRCHLHRTRAQTSSMVLSMKRSGASFMSKPLSNLLSSGMIRWQCFTKF